jgi:hypothetical protein
VTSSSSTTETNPYRRLAQASFPAKSRRRRLFIGEYFRRPLIIMAARDLATPPRGRRKNSV